MSFLSFPLLSIHCFPFFFSPLSFLVPSFFLSFLSYHFLSTSSFRSFLFISFSFSSLVSFLNFSLPFLTFSPQHSLSISFPFLLCFLSFAVLYLHNLLIFSALSFHFLFFPFLSSLPSLYFILISLLPCPSLSFALAIVSGNHNLSFSSFLTLTCILCPLEHQCLLYITLFP